MTDLVKTANERLKDQFGSLQSTSLIVAVVGHALVLQFFPPLTVEEWEQGEVVLTHLETLKEIVIPVAPDAIPRPATPVIAEGLEIEATIPVVGFREVVDLPPPPPDIDRGIESEAGGGFVVYTVAPVLLDPDGFQRALMRSYPRALRDAGIGGTVVLHVQIDVDGRTQSATVEQSSGYSQLDQVALRLTDQMRFRPALNRDQRVAVLVSIPVEFKVRN